MSYHLAATEIAYWVKKWQGTPLHKRRSSLIIEEII